MAAFVQKQTAKCSSEDSTTIAFASVATGSLVVVSVSSDQNTTPVLGLLTKTAGTSTIGTITLDRTQIEAFIGAYASQYSFVVTAGGSLTLTWDGDSLNDWAFLTMVEFSGSWDANRVEAVNSAQGNNTAPDSSNVTTAGAAVLVGTLMMWSTDASISITPDGAWTELYEEEDGANYMTGASAYRIVTGATTDSASWTLSNDRWWAAIAVAYKESGAGGIVIPTVVRHLQNMMRA